VIVKLLCDECIGKPVLELMQATLRQCGEEVDFKHIVDYQFAGVHDDVWIPQIVAESRIIISADRGRGARRGGKLPFVCRRHNLTHVLLSASIHQMGSTEKMSAILSVWPYIKSNVTVAPWGSRFSIRKSSEHIVHCVQKL
jgi:hypothetical protein